MNRIRQSFDGLKSMMSNVIAFVAGANDEDSSQSSGEIIECDSDCSQCCSENQSISLAESSSKRSCSSKINQLAADVNSESQRSSKRRKQNSEGSSKEEEQIENKENSMI
jgi:hypothetical protein